MGSEMCIRDRYGRVSRFSFVARITAVYTPRKHIRPSHMPSRRLRGLAPEIDPKTSPSRQSHAERRARRSRAIAKAADAPFQALTVFQRRQDATQDFYKSWGEYKAGSLSGPEFTTHSILSTAYENTCVGKGPGLEPCQKTFGSATTS